MKLSIGDEAPDFMLPDQNEDIVTLEDLKGRWLVLYFYPKDMTTGCTEEGIEFSNAKDDFARMEADIVGVSPDTPKTHCRFIAKENITILLLSDPEHVIIEKYDVWKEKKMFGRKYMGVSRTTFLIDPNGKIAYIWRNVKINKHVKDVKKRLEMLRG